MHLRATLPQGHALHRKGAKAGGDGAQLQRLRRSQRSHTTFPAIGLAIATTFSPICYQQRQRRSTAPAARQRAARL